MAVTLIGEIVNSCDSVTGFNNGGISGDCFRNGPPGHGGFSSDTFGGGCCCSSEGAAGLVKVTWFCKV